nr:MAG TPA: hypothetical protein [Bacteriophage sp.]
MLISAFIYTRLSPTTKSRIWTLVSSNHQWIFEFYLKHCSIRERCIGLLLN